MGNWIRAYPRELQTLRGDKPLCLWVGTRATVAVLRANDTVPARVETPRHDPPLRVPTAATG
ncbi:hypothetical protein PMIN03_006559 [Paraphaeosphaeria minitans]